ncbi:MAG: 16S rRNA (cytidine(1402)-2'-O)-methyltransferase [Clostridia bacterium]|nr:MAG: 16S rRNA (cytidine(1402)-2'-O)-methyltransferase [Clostridia bacterium]
MPGTVYLCATPIGNLQDITLRALEVLRTADLIAAEDTRRTGQLLARYEISTPMISFHQHNQGRRVPYLRQVLEAGKTIALVTDAGMPGISDPGEVLVAEAIRLEARVVAVPGATAALAALVVSGLPTRRFAFEGFLPRAGKQRRRRLQAVSREERTLVFYESPYRLAETLADMFTIFGNRQAVVARELTKVHEEVRRGSLEELAAYFGATEAKGEVVIVVAGAS